jgi:hypothetical protein
MGEARDPAMSGRTQKLKRGALDATPMKFGEAGYSE